MKKTTLRCEAFKLYKTLCNLRDLENQSTHYYERLSHACYLASVRWARRCHTPLKHDSAGRPKKDDKKIPIGVKLPPWLNQWMKQQPESKAKLIETALVAYYQIPDYLNPNHVKPTPMDLDEYQDICTHLFGNTSNV